MPINTELVRIALDRVDGFTFERFVNDFYPGISGSGFIPLGGVKDGGADAFGGEPAFEKVGSADIFYQATVQEDFRAKIRHTVNRLREFGRDPKVLNYVTSRTIRHIDTEEDALGEDLGLTIRIRDGSYIASQINASRATAAAYENHLQYLTDFLKHVGSSTLITPTANVKSPAVYVFLRQELDRREGNTSLVNSVVDSLALWALEGTDPELNRFMTAVAVEEKILSEVPSAKPLIAGRVQGRLESLASKGKPAGRKVRWFKKEKKFCLPFDTRKVIQSENFEDEALRIAVLNGLYDRLSKTHGRLPEKDLRLCSQVTLRALQLGFEREGLEFAHFISQEAPSEFPSIADSLREALMEARVSGQRSIDLSTACLSTIRACFYNSSPEEREYLGKLARTYALLFTLQTEPRLVQYFQDMAADFRLYVGSDLLVRALSERYLPEHDRLIRNTLVLAAQAGARLVLAQPALEEVLGNLRASDFEYKNHIQPAEHRYTPQMASVAPRILNRAYLYARLRANSGDEAPVSWSDFVEQFCDFSTLHKAEAEVQLRRYLQYTFSMIYEDTVQIRSLVEPESVEGLAERLADTKKDRRLAENDALLACAIYGRRRADGESTTITEFGFNTWWLTTETKILRHTADLTSANHGARYIMRPDFLLNFLAFAPSVDQARRTLKNIIPSLLGLQLSRRMNEDSFHEIMGKVKNAEALDDGRRNAAMAELSDKLKADFSKRYLIEL